MNDDAKQPKRSDKFFADDDEIDAIIEAMIRGIEEDEDEATPRVKPSPFKDRKE